MKSSNKVSSLITAMILLLIAYFLISRGSNIEIINQDEWLLQHMNKQLENGPRLPDSDSHDKTRNYIIEMLETFEWEVIEQSWEIDKVTFTNIIAYDNTCLNTEKIIIGAHYDSRIYADHDPDIEKRQEPVLGANDGASGVSVLLELARMTKQIQSCAIVLVFFDAEDNGGINNYDWILGSRYFVKNIDTMPFKISKAIIVDMIGDADLNIYYERHSDSELNAEIWSQAENLGYNTYFIQEEKYSILDDHIPFIEAGITAIDIIDFDYPYWHTTNDTMENVSIKSLKIIVDVLYSWLETQ